MSKGTKWLLLQKWLQMGALCHRASSKVKRRSEGWERGRAASQWISRSRPGLSAGGCARGEIAGLLPRRSLHRHTAKDRGLLAAGRRSDSPLRRLRTATLFFSLAWCRLHRRCWVRDPRTWSRRPGRGRGKSMALLFPLCCYRL